MKTRIIILSTIILSIIGCSLSLDTNAQAWTIEPLTETELNINEKKKEKLILKKEKEIYSTGDYDKKKRLDSEINRLKHPEYVEYVQNYTYYKDSTIKVFIEKNTKFQKHSKWSTGYSNSYGGTILTDTIFEIIDFCTSFDNGDIIYGEALNYLVIEQTHNAITFLRYDKTKYLSSYSHFYEYLLNRNVANNEKYELKQSKVQEQREQQAEFDRINKEKQREITERSRQLEKEKREDELKLRAIEWKEKCLKKYGTRYGTEIANGRVLIGMTKEMCRDAWGQPNEINTTTTQHGATEQWVYNYKSYLYFDGDYLVVFQN